MSYHLSDLTDNPSLKRLFSSENLPCALQLWVLQIRHEGKDDEKRVLYGRLLPYSFSNNSWSYSNRDESRSFGSFRASVTRVNLYIESSLCKKLITLACEGKTISEISDDLKLKIDERLRARFGDTKLTNGAQLFRPVSHLLNRDSHCNYSLVSPHGSAGALSASICQSNKMKLLCSEGSYDTNLTSMILEQLNNETGMDFSKKDTDRLGDLELMVFPTLDDNERNLLNVDWDKDRNLRVRFVSTQLPSLEKFQFQVTIENQNQVFLSRTATAKNLDNCLHEHVFEAGQKVFDITDSVKVDIFAFNSIDSDESFLCSSWKVHYVREINLNMSFIGSRSSPVKFDWLEKAATPQTAKRVEQAMSFLADNNISSSKVGGRKVDSWVQENQALKLLLTKLNPAPSEGRFFLKASQSNGDGKLQFVEWFKKVMGRNQNRHIAIFDPYFEDVGLNLLTLYALPKSEYTIFRSVPKPKDSNVPQRRKTDNRINSGMDNLLANCEHNRARLQRSDIKIYGMKEGRLHDRYILIIEPNGLPVEGFHLSNSFQKATENHPLLITPIPIDVLYETNQYAFDLIQEVNSVSTEENDTPSIALLFDSKASPIATKLYDPLSILNNELSGTVLSFWLKEPELKGLFGIGLKDQLEKLGILEDNSLRNLTRSGLLNCIAAMEGELSDPNDVWEVVGDILAHTSVGNSNVEQIQHESSFLSFLSDFLSCSFNKNISTIEQEVAVIDPSCFTKSLTELIHSSTQVHHFFQSTRYTLLSWGEYFAVKYLWRYAPKSLCSLIEKEVIHLNQEYQTKHALRLSLLAQAVSEIAFSLEFNICSESQKKELLKTNVAFINWFGWNVVEQQLRSSTEFDFEASDLSSFSYLEKVRFIGWALYKNANDSTDGQFYKKLIVQLQKLLPNDISSDDLKVLVDSCRGHMRELGWAEPWLFGDVIEPLLQEKRIKPEVACDIWLDEFVGLLNKENHHRSLLFSSEREGRTTNFSSYLWAHSNASYQIRCLKRITKVLNKQKQVINQPLASTSNWSAWDEALKVSLWILIFAKLAKFYLGTLDIWNHVQLEQLERESNLLAMKRPANEWQQNGEIFSFLLQVEELSARDSEKSNEIEL
ncbi:hypothetical protein MW651_004210 [Vibrio vulnificus]|nr:hypothetical protein [Vibrio vulnificus]